MNFVSVKKVSAFILLLIFSFQTLHAGCVTIWFFANRGYIAEKLCVNKDKPMLKCHGKCFLAKKLKEAESEKQQELPVSLKQIDEAAPFVISTVEYSIGITADKIPHKPAIQAIYTFNHFADILHPPCPAFS